MTRTILKATQEVYEGTRLAKRLKPPDYREAYSRATRRLTAAAARQDLLKPERVRWINAALTEPVITTDGSSYAEILCELEGRLGKLKGKSVHDVGCGTGGALVAFKGLGMTASGSEPSTAGRIAAGLGLNVANVGSEQALQTATGKFDAVISLNTLGNSVTRETRLAILDAARRKTGLQVHSLFTDELGNHRDFLADGWRTTFVPLESGGIHKTVIVTEKLERKGTTRELNQLGKR